MQIKKQKNMKTNGNKHIMVCEILAFLALMLDSWIY